MVVLTRAAAAAAAATPSKTSTVTEHGVKIVVSPSATGEGTHKRWCYEGGGKDLAVPVDDMDVFGGPLSPLTLNSSEGSLSSISSPTTTEGSFSATVYAGPSALTPSFSIHTPSPHSSFDAGSVLATPRKGKAQARPLTRSPNRIGGRHPDFWHSDPDLFTSGRIMYSANGAVHTMSTLREEEKEARRREAEEKMMLVSERIALVEMHKMEQRRVVEVAEKERVLGLTREQQMEEEAYWDRYDRPHPRSLLWPKGVRFDLPDSGTDTDCDSSTDDMMDDDDIVPYDLGPNGERLGREGTVICDEYGAVIMGSDGESSHWNSAADAMEFHAQPGGSRPLGPHGTHLIDVQQYGPHGTHLVPQERRLGPHGTHLI